MSCPVLHLMLLKLFHRELDEPSLSQLSGRFIRHHAPLLSFAKHRNNTWVQSGTVSVLLIMNYEVH